MMLAGSLCRGLVLVTGQLAAAQMVSRNLTGDCSPMSTKGNGTFSAGYSRLINATGTTSFTLQELTGNDQPWYYYLTLEEGIFPNDRSGGAILRWLGLPESFLNTSKANETRVCMYSIPGLDKDMTNKSGNQTCQGIVSEKCAQSILQPKDDQVGFDSLCPTIRPDKDCKADLFSSGKPFLFIPSSIFTMTIRKLPASVLQIYSPTNDITYRGSSTLNGLHVLSNEPPWRGRTRRIHRLAILGYFIWR